MCTCLGSKYPDAVPIKNVEASTVSEALMDIFLEIVLPAELLTDYGSVFVSKLMKQFASSVI